MSHTLQAWKPGARPRGRRAGISSETAGVARIKGSELVVDAPSQGAKGVAKGKKPNTRSPERAQDNGADGGQSTPGS